MDAEQVAKNVAHFLRTGERWYISIAGFLAAYAAGVRDFYGANLMDAILTDAVTVNADLTGANLTGANLMNADLTGADLTGADLTGAFLSDANLTDANLTGAFLTGAVLTDADLTGAFLTNANLTDANLTGAVTVNADLTGADIRRCIGALSSSFSMFRSSGNRPLDAAVDVVDGGLVLLLKTGCTGLITPDEMRAKVREDYGEKSKTPSPTQVELYEAAIVFAEASFAVLVKDKKLDYLIELAAKDGN